MRLFLILLLISELTLVAYSCFCFPTHLQQHFCKSQFVIHAFPFQKLQSQGGFVTYRVLVLEVLKDTSGTIQLWSINTLATTSSSCEIGVQLFVSYLYGGRFENGRFRVDGCELHRRWDVLTECEKALLHGTYGYNNSGYDCSCDVEYNCRPGETCSPDPATKCLWSPTSSSGDTYCARKDCEEYNICELRNC